MSILISLLAFFVCIILMNAIAKAFIYIDKNTNLPDYLMIPIILLVVISEILLVSCALFALINATLIPFIHFLTHL